ncbi:MAG: DNA replication licensing factor, partial [Candidatus Bathyarchaeia archaeon]
MQSFEVMLADGEKLKIGRLVDGLFQEYAKKKIIGIDCEILPIRELNLKLITTRDLKRFETVNVDRVSRHTAPDSFIQISYSNGREVLVTPDHPVFIYRDGGLSTIPAYQIKEGEWEEFY